MTREIVPRNASRDEYVEEGGGVFLVLDPGKRPVFVATNRDAAEQALMAKARQSGIPPARWRIEVWAAQDRWPPVGQEGGQ